MNTLFMRSMKFIKKNYVKEDFGNVKVLIVKWDWNAISLALNSAANCKASKKFCK